MGEAIGAIAIAVMVLGMMFGEDVLAFLLAREQIRHGVPEKKEPNETPDD